MLDRVYRQRLEADLKRWETDGTITPATAQAIRNALGPVPAGVGVATIVSIVGGLLIAAAVLSFVAANWAEIPRATRLVLLLGSIVAANGLGAWFAVRQQTHLADLSATVGTILFGAAIALVGQMYHMPSDFAAGLMLWALGAMAAAILTGSRGALAVALAVGVGWSAMAAYPAGPYPHWPFLVFWGVSAVAAVAWNAPSARHLAAVALCAWWVVTAVKLVAFDGETETWSVFNAGLALTFGAGLALATKGPLPLRRFGQTLATYGAFGIALGLGLVVFSADEPVPSLSDWVGAVALAGAILAGLAALVSQRAGSSLAALAVLLVVVGENTLLPVVSVWSTDALALGAGLSLVLSGAVEENRPRLVAGWIGLGLSIACITWMVEGGLLVRAVFLAIAGGAAIVLALALGQVLPKQVRS